MKQILFFLFPACLAFAGCSSAKSSRSSMILTGISGVVTELTGNQMPMKDRPVASPKGIVTTVLIYEPTNMSQVTRTGTSPLYTAILTKRVASVDTDSTGAFTVALPAGSYSLFVKRGDQFYANLFDTQNNISLFTVEEGKLTRVTLSVTSKASF